MIQALHIGASGLAAQQKNIDTISNNVANASTSGFKKTSVEFKDSLYATMNNFTKLDVNLQKGSGVIAAETNKIFSEGAAIQTGNPLDCFLSGDGFFEVMAKDGKSSLYTKNGGLNITSGIDGSYLTNGSNYVLSDKGEKIKIPATVSKITVSHNGEIVGSDKSVIAKMSVVAFPNKQGLLEAGANLYKKTGASGEPVDMETYRLETGVIEGSNVELGQEMTDLILSQRAYQMASRVITMADQMEGVANNIR